MIQAGQLVKFSERKLQRAPKTTTGRVFSSSQTTPGLSFAAVLRSNTQQQQQQQQQPEPPSVAQACSSPLRHSQQVPSQSVQAPNANSSSLNNMSTTVVTIFQQIMAELNGTESEEARIMAITKIVFKLMKQSGRQSS
jgi:hypothetical protein